MLPLVGLLLPALPGLINLVESIFSTPKSGDTKMSAIVQSLRGVISPLLANGTIKTSPTDDALQAMVETVLAQMKNGGTLGQPSTTEGQLYLLRGSVTPLTTAK